MRLNDIIRYLVTIGEVADRDTAIKDFQNLTETYGYRYHCFFHEPKPIDNPAQLIVAANLEQRWIDRYVGKRYIVNDPIIRYLLKTSKSFTWAQAEKSFQNHPHFRRIQKVMQDGRAHGLAYGHVFPIFGRNGLMGAAVLSGPDEVELSPVETTLLDAAARATYFRLLELEGGRFTEKIGDGETDVILTYREAQALSNMADGMTSAEIAERLGVAPTTVDWYGASVQEKLKAKNRVNAVAIAIRKGMIS